MMIATIVRRSEFALREAELWGSAARALKGFAFTPKTLEQAWRNAQKDGVNGIRNFLKQYGSSVQDPRKAWLELDYCMLLAREDPAALAGEGRDP